VLASQGGSREEREERVVVIVSGYEIRKKNRGVEKDSNADKGSITVSPTVASDVRSLRVSGRVVLTT
jgi:hypothetical protein